MQRRTLPALWSCGHDRKDFSGLFADFDIAAHQEDLQRAAEELQSACNCRYEVCTCDIATETEE